MRSVGADCDNLWNIGLLSRLRGVVLDTSLEEREEGRGGEVWSNGVCSEA